MMINVYSFTAPTEEECREQCLEELDLYENEIIYRTFEEDQKEVLEVIKIQEIKEFIQEYLSTLFKLMNINAKFKVFEEDKIFNVQINTKKSSIIIGKDGKNLSALQYLLRQVIRAQTMFNIKVNLDISNYKFNRQVRFENEIKKIINEVLKSKINTKLDPMNSFNRRIVHSVAGNYYNIATESYGEEPNRYVVIQYVDN